MLIAFGLPFLRNLPPLPPLSLPESSRARTDMGHTLIQVTCTCPIERWNPRRTDHHLYLQGLRLPAISYHVTLHRVVLLRRPRMVIHLDPHLDRPLLVQGV